MTIEFMYSNNEDYLWNIFAENAYETYQSAGITNPDTYSIWELIDSWDLTVLETVKLQLREVFNSHKLLLENVNCEKEEQAFLNWHDFEKKILGQSSEFQIYQDEDFYLVDTICGGCKEEYRIRKS